MSILTNTKIELYNPSSGERHTVRSFEGLTIEESIEDPVKTFSFTAKEFNNSLRDKFSVNSEVKIYHGKKNEPLAHIFTGIVKDTPKEVDGVQKSFQFSGTDYLGKLQDLIINRSYIEENIKDIVLDLWEYKGEKWVDIGFIQDIDYTITINFIDLHFYECLEKLAEVIDFIFYVDKDKKLHFHEKYHLKNPNWIRRNTFEKGSASFSEDISRLVNVLDIYGGKRLSQDFHEYILADGLNNTFKLKYQPRQSTKGKVELYEINENKVRIREIPLAASGLEETEHQEGREATLQYHDQNIEFADVPESGRRFEVVYRYERNLRTRVTKQQSIDTYGEFEDILTFTNITDPIALKDRGMVHLDKFSEPLIVGSLNPFRGDYEVGEIVHVYLYEIGINHDLQITTKTTTIEHNFATYSLGFEQKPPITRTLKNILERLKELEERDGSDIVELYESFTDSFRVDDFVSVEYGERKDGFIIGRDEIGDDI